MEQVEVQAVGGLEIDPLVATLRHHATPGSEELHVEPTPGPEQRDVEPGPEPEPPPDAAAGGIVRGQGVRGQGVRGQGVLASYRRLVELGGAPTPVTLHLRSAGVTLEAPGPVLAEAVDLVCWWFALAHDPRVMTRALSGDPVVGPLVRARPALRPLRHPVGFEAAVDTVVGQQVTLASARLFGERLRTAYSPAVVDGLRPFPAATALAGAPLEELRAAVGLTTARARTVRAVAELFADGFVLGRATDPVVARSALLGVPGVGPWTVEYLALRVLGDDDAFPASDAVVRRALGGVPAREAEHTAESWRPHRAWATAHLWAGQLGPPVERRES